MINWCDSDILGIVSTDNATSTMRPSCLSVCGLCYVDQISETRACSTVGHQRQSNIVGQPRGIECSYSCHACYFIAISISVNVNGKFLNKCKEETETDTLKQSESGGNEKSPFERAGARMVLIYEMAVASFGECEFNHIKPCYPVVYFAKSLRA